MRSEDRYHLPRIGDFELSLVSLDDVGSAQVGTSGGTTKSRRSRYASSIALRTALGLSHARPRGHALSSPPGEPREPTSRRGPLLPGSVASMGARYRSPPSGC